MITSAISERREVGGAPYMRITTDRQPPRRELIRPAEFIGDVVNQIAPERRLAAAVLRQATVGLRRFQESKEAAGQTVLQSEVAATLARSTGPELSQRELQVVQDITQSREQQRDGRSSLHWRIHREWRTKCMLSKLNAPGRTEAIAMKGGLLQWD